MLTFTLTDTGYNVHLDGKLWVECPYDTEKNGKVPFDSDDAKRAHALANFPDATEL